MQLTKLAVLLIVQLAMVGNLQAQKIKYKDLYVLLRAKNYKDAGPFLTKFLAANPEHPNANYQMGLMLEHKLGELDILKQSDEITARADSALMYFDKAYTLITPKDVKKHDDDYYESFKRRNLRTGKFEVILSDVQLDIETRKKSLQTKKEAIAAINVAFTKAVNYYTQAVKGYTQIKSAYSDELTLTLGAADTTKTILTDIQAANDSALYHFKTYKKLRKTFNSKAPDILLTIEPITGLAEKGLHTPDFYDSKIKWINYSDWAADILQKINSLVEFQQQLIAYDASLDELDASLEEDSASITDIVFAKITDPAIKKLKELDPESAILALLLYKTGQLNFKSDIVTWFKHYADTLDVGLQVNYVEKMQNEWVGVEKLHSRLAENPKENLWERYHTFISQRYQSLEGCTNFMDAQDKVIQNQKQWLDSLQTAVLEREKWAYYGNDSLRLQITNDSTQAMHIIFIDSLENRKLLIAGLEEQEASKYLFFVEVPSSRYIDTLYRLKTNLDLTGIKKNDFIAQATPAVANTTLFLIGSPKKNKYYLVLVRFAAGIGIVWNKPIELPAEVPPSLNYTDGVILIMLGETIKKYSMEDGHLLE